MLRRTSLVCVAPQDPAQPDAFPMDKLANDKIAVTLNDQTGAIEHLYDVPTEREILRFAQGPALEVNRRPVSPRVASVHDAWGDVTVRLVSAGDRRQVVVFSAEDNMIKGASGQAVQNMNLMFDLDETAGLL